MNKKILFGLLCVISTGVFAQSTVYKFNLSSTLSFGITDYHIYPQGGAITCSPDQGGAIGNPGSGVTVSCTDYAPSGTDWLAIQLNDDEYIGDLYFKDLSATKNNTCFITPAMDGNQHNVVKCTTT